MDERIHHLLKELISKIDLQENKAHKEGLYQAFEEVLLRYDQSYTNQIESYKAENEYLYQRFLELRKELTESINETDNTSEGLKTLLSSIPNLVYFKDLNLKFLMVNRSFETWINIAAVDLKGKRDHEVYPSYMNRNIVNKEKEVLETGLGIYNFEERITLDDEELWLLTSISPFKDVDGNLQGVVTSSLDITPRKKHEIELKEANDKIKDALSIKNEFIANISHEFRTPLHAISGSLEILKRKVQGQDIQELYDTIEFSNQSLLKQLNGLLLYLQAEDQNMKLEEESFNLKAEMDQLVSLSKKEVDLKGVELRLFIEDRIPGTFIGDKSKLMMLLEILLSNSVKFTEKGFIHLIIKQIKSGAQSIRLGFDIIDTGIGIRSDKQSEVFDLFSMGDSSHVKKYAGTGLGLSVAKKLLDILNAKYGLESQEHVGSHFWIELELKLPHSEKPKMEVLASELPVLLVEDNLVNQKIAFFTMKKMGFQVDIAENGQEAIEKFKQKTYRLVLMDIQMPVMNGFDATKGIRAYEKEQNTLEPSIIIALSANVLSRDVQYCFEVGMNEFISKPFSSDKLLEKIKIYFNLK
jgi:PAS domain S-box-containing protein